MSSFRGAATLERHDIVLLASSERYTTNKKAFPFPAAHLNINHPLARLVACEGDLTSKVLIPLSSCSALFSSESLV
jgi:hypothetical protein